MEHQKSQWRILLRYPSTTIQKVKDHEQEVTVLILPKTLQKYVLYQSHTSLGHNCKTRLHQFLKRQYYWKDSKSQHSSL